ncbi:MAG TPA: GTP-binding protein [Bauldia sp.]|nr:GTP-binding protein [Bauldia sp.]
MARTPVTILTGFLGSGKTTLLNRALRDPAMARTAVVINEFGEISIDHSLTATSDDTIVVLENGCLCCTVFGDLVGTLNNLYHRREAGEIPLFDHVVIETSGLADPAPVAQAFLSEPTLAGLYRIGMVLTTVDAVNGPGTLDNHDESVRQVALADHILITKLDLVSSPADMEASLAARLRKLNPAAKISRIDDPALDVIALLSGAGLDPTDSDAAAKEWLNLAAYEHAGHDHDHDHDGHDHHGHHHHDADIASFAFIREEPTSRYALQLLLNALEQNLGPNLLRVKGLVNVAEEPDKPAVIQGAQHLLHNIAWLDRWPDSDRRTRIVFITQNISRASVEEMIGLLDRVATRTAKARERAAQV